LKKFLSLLTLATLLSILSLNTVGCSSTDSDDSTDTTGTTDTTTTTTTEYEILKGTIEEDVTLDASETYEFRGYVYVDDGATLTIPAGTLIKSSGQSALIVRRGGKLIVNGTAAEPVVMTSLEESPSAGDWAGLAIMGKSPVSTADSTLGFEAIPSETFGGSDPADNSGSIRYLRVEYAGWEVATDQELNGITFGGVGTGTVVEWVQVHEGEDDAYEWFGGTVNGKWLVATGYNDDGFDIDYGFSGTITNGLNIQNANSDEGIEGGSKAEGTRYTNTTFDKLTIVANDQDNAILFKKNVTGTYTDVLLVGKGAANAIKAEGNSVDFINDSTTTFSNVFYTGTFTAVAPADINTVISAAFTSVTDGIGADCASKGDAATAGAGAVQADNLWYEGWTLEGSVSCE
jgi:hypothetical protein